MASFYGDHESNHIVAGTGPDSLAGRAGDDTLDGGSSEIEDGFFGGIASYTDGDTMRGGLGNDLYKVTATREWLWARHGADMAWSSNGIDAWLPLFGASSEPDEVIEQAGEGIDTVLAFVSYQLPDNVERLLLAEDGIAIDGEGNDLDNLIRGNSKGNTLHGHGGNDTLDGGEGFDVAAYADAAAGVVVRLATTDVQDTGGDGSDKLISIEALSGSQHADRLSGTAGDDLIFGSNGADTLVGAAGDDHLIGGADDDSILGGKGTDTVSYVEAAAKVVVRLASGGAQDTGGSGTDTLVSCENLVGSQYGDALYGSDASNSLDGGPGRDALHGRGGDDVLNGGRGTDTLAGGAGHDDFVFDRAPSAAGADTIVDFTHADRIVLDTSTSLFAALRDGDATVHALEASRFHAGDVATASSQRIVYDASTGALYYDPDGSGVKQQVMIAMVNAADHPTLTADDIFIGTI
jgi:Ca2+-binding RTX toxin-like protein